MKTLQIDEANARKLYKDATPEFKTTLEDTFGKEFFSDKITDRVKTYEDACRVLGEVQLNELACFISGLTQDEIFYRKLKTITKALNEGWTPDWSDGDQKKWFPYFNASSGFAFSDTDCLYSGPRAGDGSRLCFKSKELAEYAGRQFTDLYKGFIL
ncbi:hypothetical protein SAMN05216357_112107 [Porphyromonadaceae bacterium KH3CP3RA]|nr:hypothetical protein SAMN05216357_112107 [Porphyromonadaceae bacterium KH3CP3RA]